MQIHCARNPIFDQQRNVFGYDLSFRRGFQDYYDHLNPQNTADPIPFFKFRELTDGRRGFVAASRELVLNMNTSVFPKGLVTLAVPEDIPPEQDVLDACKRLKNAGVILAKNRVRPDETHSPLLDLLDVARLDYQAHSVDDRHAICEMLHKKHVKVLASNLESSEDYEDAASGGFHYYQGGYFFRPMSAPQGEIHANKLTYLQVMNEVFKPSLLYDELAGLIEQDVSMSYKLLKFINSAWFGLKYEIKSIKHALVLLGPQEIKRWLSIAVVRDTGRDKPYELLLRCLTRAKLAELIAEQLPGFSRRASELFLMGLLSAIDALIDQPMNVVLEGLPVSASIKSALLGERGGLRDVYDVMLNYEAGRWDDFSETAGVIRLDENLMPDMVAEAQKWGNNILGES
ncbi:MAG: HDOD domain-containing protein [Phycisphaerae bacterium]|nr:HDOD domain-containing protein [Phycisphaerae bacterium]